MHNKKQRLFQAGAVPTMNRPEFSENSQYLGFFLHQNSHFIFFAASRTDGDTDDDDDSQSGQHRYALCDSQKGVQLFTDVTLKAHLIQRGIKNTTIVFVATPSNIENEDIIATIQEVNNFSIDLCIQIGKGFLPDSAPLGTAHAFSCFSNTVS